MPCKPWFLRPRGTVAPILRPRGSIAARFVPPVAPKRRPRSNKEKEELADANIKKEIEPVLVAPCDKRKPALRKDTTPKPFFRMPLNIPYSSLRFNGKHAKKEDSASSCGSNSRRRLLHHRLHRAAQLSSCLERDIEAAFCRPFVDPLFLGTDRRVRQLLANEAGCYSWLHV